MQYLIQICLTVRTIYDLQNKTFNDSHYYQIRILQCPLFCKTLGDITRELEYYHMGIGFVDLNSSNTFSIQYEYNDQVAHQIKDVFRPLTRFNKTKNLYEFYYNYSEAVFIKDELEVGECFWEQQTIVADGVSGEIINKWTADFAQNYINNNLHYVYMEMWYNQSIRFENISAHQCHDFVFQGLNDMAFKYNVKFNGKSASRLYTYFNLDQAPTLLNESNKEDNQKIYEFFVQYEKLIEQKTEIQLQMMFIEFEIPMLHIIHNINNQWYELKINQRWTGHKKGFTKAGDWE